MPEKVYGWYPPNYNVYASNRTKHGYEKEALFKHSMSRFQHGQPGSHILSRPSSSTTRPLGLTRNASPKSHHTGSPTRSMPTLRARTKSAPAARQDLSSLISVTSPPTQTIHTNRGMVHMPENPGPPVPHVYTREDWYPLAEPIVSRDFPPQPYPPKKQRAKSATVRSPTQKAEIPKRSIKSAGPVRSQPLQYDSVPVSSPDPEPMNRAHIPPPAPSDQMSDFLSPHERPQAPIPQSPSDLFKDDTPPPTTPRSLESPETYEDALETYGWLAEVHGDPFGIKKTVLPERLAYTVKCPEPEIPPNPPRGHMQNFETFFYNTIPRRPAVCTVHKEWVSEVLALKRMELAKKQKDKTYRYRNTNYAFLY